MPCPFPHLLKILKMLKLLHKLRPYGKDRVMEPRDTKTMVMYNFIINKHENIYVGVYWYVASVPG
jgi:hypothetical protein